MIKQFFVLLRLKGQYRLLVLFFMFYFINSLATNNFNNIHLIGFSVFSIFGLSMNSGSENEDYAGK